MYSTVYSHIFRRRRHTSCEQHDDFCDARNVHELEGNYLRQYSCQYYVYNRPIRQIRHYGFSIVVNKYCGTLVFCCDWKTTGNEKFTY